MAENDLDNDSDNDIFDIIPINDSDNFLSAMKRNFNLLEKWEIHKAKAEAKGHSRMVIADFLIDEGFMKRVFRK